MTVLKDLDALIDLLSDESSWTRGVSARDSVGEMTEIYSEDAVSFCLTGGIWRVTSIDTKAYDNLLGALRRTISEHFNSFVSVVHFNDHAAGHRDVVNLLKETRRRLEKEAAE